MQTVDLNYQAFLESKIKVAERHGIDVNPDDMHPSLRPDQKEIVMWGLGLGAALIALDAGCGKSRIVIEIMRQLKMRFGGKCLIATELGAMDTFTDSDPEVGEGAAMGLKLEYVTTMEELMASEADICVTNYERIRMGNFDFSQLTAFAGDEGNYVKNMASDTTDALMRELAKVRFKYIATATPSPNETLELVNYAHALGICDRGQILTRFFQRNSTKAGELTLHEHHTDDFWLWVRSWCIAITSPADLGYNYPGFDLPKLNVEWVEVQTETKADAGKEKDGQYRAFITSRSGLSEAAKIKRNSIPERLSKLMDIVNAHPTKHFILWHNLNDEHKALNRAFRDIEVYGDISGSTPDTLREKRVVDFTKGQLKYLATKPELNGRGCNFQKHCHHSVFMGLNDSFDEFYQALKRIYRFYQKEECFLWALYTPEEYEIVQNLKRKWAEHDEMRRVMRELYAKYGLNHAAEIEEKKRSFQVTRTELKGENWELVITDAILEWRNRPTDSLDLILSSFPFGNHYEYTDKYNDLGHNIDNKAFVKQLSYLLPEMLRALKPGRIAAIDLKNRIHYGSVTGNGFSTFHRFTHLVCDAMEAAGFYTIGFHYCPTDVVAENNQTYRLGFSEMSKDATKMGSGIPEEIWLFRKAPTSNANAYADTPVTKNMCRCSFCGHEDLQKEFVVSKPTESFVYRCGSCKQYLLDTELILPELELQYSLPKWQIDADSFWGSSGNRLLTPKELKEYGISQLQKWWKKFNTNTIYSFEGHVRLLESLEGAGKLSRTFTTLPMQSKSPFIWSNVNRMRGLNLEQSRRKQQNHICPMAFDKVDRLIDLYTEPGETVGDPFGGICTTGVRALVKKRKAYLTELNEVYGQTGAMYMRETEIKNNLPTLFDVLTDNKAA